MEISHWAYGQVTEAALLADPDADVDNWPVTTKPWAFSGAPTLDEYAVVTRGLDGVLKGQGLPNGEFVLLAANAAMLTEQITGRFPDGVLTAPATIRYRDINEADAFLTIQCLVDRQQRREVSYSDGTFAVELHYRVHNAVLAPEGA